MPDVALNTGHNMPVLGFGTSANPLPPNEALVSIFVDAIEVGYRHFDTAAVYGTEEAIGRCGQSFKASSSQEQKRTFHHFKAMEGRCTP
ncbi:hypothetical protein L6164_008137 [Bauhinia variegata]|uniref:Uncharacterized protein n=1 Tax=Bauhinia variegata TaxID=167791 RepID=A0ACB9PG33_BAUVA|nr:hypothetical protein L6164_008137 [Bauhinia variegata]